MVKAKFYKSFVFVITGKSEHESHKKSCNLKLSTTPSFEKVRATRTAVLHTAQILSRQYRNSQQVGFVLYHDITHLSPSFSPLPPSFSLDFFIMSCSCARLLPVRLSAMSHQIQLQFKTLDYQEHRLWPCVCNPHAFQVSGFPWKEHNGFTYLVT